ncbi:MAG: hypothetical protein ACSLFH_03175 [Desulfuromonadales bacterium]
MKRFTIAMMALVLAAGMPTFAVAMSHESQTGKSKEMTKDSNMDHSKGMSQGMQMGQAMAGDNADFVEIGTDTQDGVVATVKVKTYDEKTLASMKKMGMDATHHVMVFFTDQNSGDEIAGGMAALKIKGSEADPVMMMLMGAGFGGDVALEDGMHTFEFGTKLEDGKKRQFSIMFHNM